MESSNPRPNFAANPAYFARAGAFFFLIFTLAFPACSQQEEFPSATPTAVPKAALVVAAPSPTPSPSPVSPTPRETNASAQQTGGSEPLSSPTPQGLQLKTTGNVYCRSGPAVYYKAIAAFPPGTTLPVLGRTATESNYWLVQTDMGLPCWIWGKYADLTGGDPKDLPVMTPPPPPPAAFIISVDRVGSCNGTWGLTLLIQNKGLLPLESIEATVMDQAKTFEYHYPLNQSHRFVWWYNCELKGQNESIPPGGQGMITIPTDSQNLQGWPLVVRVRACTENELRGECFERTTLLFP
ncbi:MAG: SH3 domain-containing protein [Chloroflexi bacterium]|nr:SH3 domain-containing protein [Chloroflexota bacterium]